MPGIADYLKYANNLTPGGNKLNYANWFQTQRPASPIASAIGQYTNPQQGRTSIPAQNPYGTGRPFVPTGTGNVTGAPGRPVQQPAAPTMDWDAYAKMQGIGKYAQPAAPTMDWDAYAKMQGIGKYAQPVQQPLNTMPQPQQYTGAPTMQGYQQYLSGGGAQIPYAQWFSQNRR